MSRPALPPEESASAVVHLRVLPRQKSAWVRAAQRAGQNLSAWLCEAADAKLPADVPAEISASAARRERSPAQLAALADARQKRDIAAPRTPPDGWRSVEHLLDDTREYLGRHPGLQSELAQYLNVTSKSIQRWMRREKTPLQPTLDSIAQWRRVKTAGL